MRPKLNKGLLNRPLDKIQPMQTHRKQRGRLSTITILSILGSCLLLLSSSAPFAESITHQYNVAAKAGARVLSGPNTANISESPLSKKYLDKLLAAELALSREQPEVALANYIWVAKETQDPKISRRATEIALAYGVLPAAQEAASLWAKLAPQDLEAQITTAAIFIRAGELKQALPFLQRVEVISPTQAQEHFLILYKQLDDPADRANIVNTLERLHSKNAQLALAEIYLFQSDDAKALSNSEQALQQDPNNIQAIILYTQSLISNNDIEKANDFLNNQIRQHPKDSQLKLFYVESYYNQGLLDKARQQINELIKMDSLAPTELLGLARLSLEGKWYPEAEKLLKKMESFPDHKDTAHYFLGRLYDLQQKPNEAITLYLSVQNPPFYMIAHIRASLLYGALQKPTEALTVLDNLESNGEYDKQIALTKIEILSGSQKNAQALAIINNQLQQTPEDSELLYSHAVISQRMGDMKTAEKDFKTILELDPNHLNALNGLGFILADQTTRYKEADALLTKANTISPNNPSVLDSMGWLQLKMGNPDKAVVLFKQALTLLPDPEIAAHLGEALWAMNKQAEANQIWKGALKNNPAHPLILETMQRLLKKNSHVNNR